MKGFLKMTLRKLGLLKWVTNLSLFKSENSLERYRNVDAWQLNVGEVSIKFDTSDWYSKNWFYPRYSNGKIHEPSVTQLFIDHLNNNSMVLDIGGHIGYYSCLAGHLAKNGNVHVFEVDPKCINLIRKNLKFNNLDNVFVHNFAVSDSKNSVRIPRLKNPKPGLSINSNLANKYIEVESVIIDEFLALRNFTPDFIKIDVEGSEWKVLQGMEITIKKYKPILLIEIHVDKLREYFNTHYKKIIKLLKSNGYSLLKIEHRSKNANPIIVDYNSTLQGNVMILCTNK